jgi:hypothetical protein
MTQCFQIPTLELRVAEVAEVLSAIPELFLLLQENKKQVTRE